MFGDQDLQHGAAILALCDARDSVCISRLPQYSGSVYQAEQGGQRATFLLKRSTKKRTPWQFTFSDGEARTLSDLVVEGHRPFIGLVCHTDGVCCVAWDNLIWLTGGEDGIAATALSIRRPRRGSYHVSGPGRVTLDRTIPRTDWPTVLFRTATPSSK